MGRLAGENARDHRPCRLPMDVTAPHTQAHAGIGEHFVQAVFLGRHEGQRALAAAERSDAVRAVGGSEGSQIFSTGQSPASTSGENYLRNSSEVLCERIDRKSP